MKTKQDHSGKVVHKKASLEMERLKGGDSSSTTLFIDFNKSSLIIKNMTFFILR